MRWCRVPVNFSLLGVDDVIFLPPDDKLCKGGGVIDVILVVPINNGGCSKAPFD